MPTSNYIGRTGVGQLVERAVTYYTFLQNSKNGSGGGGLSSWGSAYISPSFLGWKIYSSIPDRFIYLVNYSLGFRLGKSICNSGGNLAMAPVTTTHPNFFYIHLLCRKDQGVAASEKCVSHSFSPASAPLCRGSARGGGVPRILTDWQHSAPANILIYLAWIVEQYICQETILNNRVIRWPLLGANNWVWYQQRQRARSLKAKETCK